MIRVLISTLFPLLLPTAVYFLWLWVLRARIQAALGKGEAAAAPTPWTWLLAAGVTLMLVALTGLSLWGGAPASSRYIPPHMDNGQLIPGRMVPP